MDALRRIHQSLAPQGILLDMRPGIGRAVVHGGGDVLGRLDDLEFLRDSRAVDRALGATLRAGLFVLEDAAAFAWVHRFDSPDELLAEVEGWNRMRVSARLRRRLEVAARPLEVCIPSVARRFRAGTKCSPP